MTLELGVVLGLLVGVPLGFALGRVAVRRSPDALVAAARDELARSVVQRAEAVAEQVEQYAEDLTGEDPVLRARLRQFQVRTW